jgi:hypothetical protein
MTEEEKIEDMDKEIAELKKKKAEIVKKTEVVESPKIEEKKPEPPKVEKKEKEEFVPPDPTKKILEEGNIYIHWIDGRYHIKGIRGIPNGNKIIVRSLADVDRLVVDLLAAVKNFDQKEMISTKK